MAVGETLHTRPSNPAHILIQSSEQLPKAGHDGVHLQSQHLGGNTGGTGIRGQPELYESLSQRTAEQTHKKIKAKPKAGHGGTYL